MATRSCRLSVPKVDTTCFSARTVCLAYAGIAGPLSSKIKLLSGGPEALCWQTTCCLFSPSWKAAAPATMRCDERTTSVSSTSLALPTGYAMSRPLDCEMSERRSSRCSAEGGLTNVEIFSSNVMSL
eukprot:3923011-Prymnesium_polylepis.7